MYKIPTPVQQIQSTRIRHAMTVEARSRKGAHRVRLLGPSLAFLGLVACAAPLLLLIAG